MSMTVEDLKNAVITFVNIAEEEVVSNEFKELDNNGVEILNALSELEQYRAIGTVEELRKAVKEEDVLKFYYIESEDKYVVGQRVDTRYYGEIGKTGITFYMSRYLPWGEHVVAPETSWKEHTYPSEPKEIPFFEWLQCFMKKEYGGTPEEFRQLKEKYALKGCGNCKHQPEPLTPCEWLKSQTQIIKECPRWERKE